MLAQNTPASNLIAYEVEVTTTIIIFRPDPVGNAYEDLAQDITPVCPRCGKREKRCLDWGKCYWWPDFNQL